MSRTLARRVPYRRIFTVYPLACAHSAPAHRTTDYAWAFILISPANWVACARPGGNSGLVPISDRAPASYRVALSRCLGEPGAASALAVNDAGEVSDPASWATLAAGLSRRRGQRFGCGGLASQEGQ